MLLAVSGDVIRLAPLTEPRPKTTRRTSQFGFAVLTSFALWLIGMPLLRMSQPLTVAASRGNNPETFLRICDMASRLVEGPVRVTGSQFRSRLGDLTELSKEPFAIDSQVDNAGHRARMITLRSLCRFADGAALYCLNQKQSGDAAAIWLGLSRVGDGIVCGTDGSVSDVLAGLAIHSAALNEYGNNREMFSQDQNRAMLVELIEQERRRITPDAIRRRCNALNEQTYGWRLRFVMESQRVLSRPSHGELQTFLTPSLQAIDDAILRRDRSRRLLMTELAIELYRSEHGQLPSDLEMLTPSLLDRVPIDPFNPAGDVPLIYRVEGQKYLLYSVGHDGKDDGGVFGTEAQMYESGLDFDIDTLNRSESAVE
ncbi:MAG: hypothetical protein AAFX06_09795 [Planctomycetota bacterium]